MATPNLQRFNDLPSEWQAAIRAAIEKAKKDSPGAGHGIVTLADGSGAYAQRHDDSRFSWGFNHYSAGLIASGGITNTGELYSLMQKPSERADLES